MAAVFFGCGDYLLHAVNVRRESSDDYAAFGFPEIMRESFADVFFGRGETFDLYIRALTHEHQDTFITEFAETLKINGLAVDRREVDLKVTGVDDLSCGSVDAERVRIRDTVIDPDKLG